jgi:hypothetical protein
MGQGMKKQHAYKPPMLHRLNADDVQGGEASCFNGSYDASICFQGPANVPPGCVSGNENDYGNCWNGGWAEGGSCIDGWAAAIGYCNSGGWAS